MIKIVDGKLTGTCDIPADVASVEMLIKFGGIDFSVYTNKEIAKLTGVSESGVRHAMRCCGVKAKLDHDAFRGNGGRKPRSKTKKIAVYESDNITIKRLKQLFLARNETIKELADGIGTSQSTVNNWLHRGAIPSMKYLKLIADRYHVTVEYLAGQSNRPLRRY